MPDFNFDFDFDAIIDRRAVAALTHHAIVLGGDGMGLVPAGVGDMDLRVAPCIARRALRPSKSPAAQLHLTDSAGPDAALMDRPGPVNRPIVCSAKGVWLSRPSERVPDMLDQIPQAPLCRKDGHMILNKKEERVD